MYKYNYDYAGLNLTEVKENLLTFGENKLATRKKLNPLVAYFSQFKDLMVILLIIAALVSLSVTIYLHISGKLHSIEEVVISYVEPGIILLVIILNSILGAYQEVKSDQAVRALENQNIPNATVIRDGTAQTIKSNLLVPGDLIILSAGDIINADALLLKSSNLEVIEASLTGESLPVSKNADLEKEIDSILANNSHLVYSGTYVTKGSGYAVVLKTGGETEIGKINKSIQSQTKNTTPLQIKLNKLSKIFGYVGIALLFISALAQIIITNVISGSWIEPKSYINSVITGISLAVAAIPEGLIAFTTVILSIGVSKISKQNGLIKNLLAVETLGSANIICTDKTGTLTENKMTVVDVYTNKLTLDKFNNNDENLLNLIKASTIANDAFIVLKNNKFEEVGDPTETGLLRFAHKYNILKEDLLKKSNLLNSLPFDSDRKMMSVLVKENNGNIMYTKGAPDVILSLCKNIDKEEILKINNEWAEKSYRVLAFAKKQIDKTSITLEDENNFEFIGLIAMIDPPRANVKESIAEAQRAGIKVVMITGDHLVTAKAIAKDIGIYHENDLCINGAELAKMTNEELIEKVTQISVYARVNPEDKLRIVKAWQAHDKVVAMTGDGVNDAPALKASDIGCAMGITGTDVSKQSVDLILTDDNFNTIVKSVKNGRLVFDKIKTVIMNLLVSSITEILVMMIGLFVLFFVFKNYYKEGEFFILSASQLLWINLLTHGLPAIALGFVDSGKDVMSRKPYHKSESIFARGMGIELIWQSLVVSLASLISYALGALYAINNNMVEEMPKIASMCCFITMGLSTSINAINLMTDKSLFVSSMKKYWPVWLAATFSALAVILVSFVPNLSSLFKMTNKLWEIPTILSWSMPLALLLTISIEFKKFILFIKSKKTI
ncbi:Calcium-transporting ATPase lmo0841 [Mycoplasmopsis maculosa]|uniref:Calcium-transporting ATPase lmo0841 n=1 Tax=Mycoplasmopsis maculosa TaxID=114885 RepID=A0A449B3K1_9BACT|nr:cation-translocating P-type ATPase [Mycoplasmopsis maculosa]VEU75170.1 Calcium-transporting ATPase lmo0841 [Mycoplasmopsis maculosa]